MTTIEDYLKGLFSFDFTDANMTSVLLKRNVEAGIDESLVSDQDKELCMADMYIVMFNYFGQKSESVQKGSWKRTTGGVVVGVNDRKAFRDAANAIYKKYGEPILVNYFENRTNTW